MIKAEYSFVDRNLVLTDELRADPDFRRPFAKAGADVKLWGYMDGTGQIAIAPVYESASVFEHNYGRVTRDGKFTYVNAQGVEAVIEVDERLDRLHKGGKFFFKEEDKWLMTDFTGLNREVLPYDSLSAYTFHKDIIGTKSGKKAGLITTSGKEILPAIYDHVTPSEISVVVAELDGKQALFSREVTQLTDFIYDKLLLPEDNKEENNAIVAVQGKKYQLLDFDGSALTDLKYKLPRFRGDQRIGSQFWRWLRFSEGLGGVSKGEDWGFMDRNGNTVIKPKFVTVSNFKHGLSEVTTRNLRAAVINRDGALLAKGRKVRDANDLFSARVTERPYDGGDPGYIYNNNGLAGLLSNSGEQLIDPDKNEFILSDSIFLGRFIEFSENNRRGLVNFQGEALRQHLPASFRSIRLSSDYFFVRFGDKASVSPPHAGGMAFKRDLCGYGCQRALVEREEGQTCQPCLRRAYGHVVMR